MLKVLSVYDFIVPAGSPDGNVTDLYHFDGYTWKSDKSAEKVVPFAIFRFAPNNIWIGGDSLSFWHYNGSWSRTAKFDIPAGYEISVITDIWGDSPENVYATGIAIHVNNERVFQSQIALLFHYDGIQWSRVKIPDMHYEFSRIRRGSSESDKFYILTSDYFTGVHSFNDTTSILEFDGKNMKHVLTGHTNWNEALSVSEIDRKLYFAQGNKLYRYRNDKLELFLEVPNLNHTIQFWGRNEQDIFIAMKDGIAHYKGNEISYIYRLNNDNSRIRMFLCFEDSILLMAYDYSTNTNLVIKGNGK